jgi:hypothetical protein
MEGGMTDRDELNRPSNLEEYYEPLEQVDDPRFGTVIIYANKYNSSDLIFAKEKLSHNLADCERDIFQAKERMRLSHDFLIKMIDFSTKSFESESSDHETDYLVTGFYEYPTHDLGSEILERQKQGRHFSGEELLQLETNLLEVLNCLKASKMIHGDIRPKYIFFDRSEKGCHKLVDRLGDPSPPNQVQVNNLKRREALYMSPALYKALSNKQAKIKHNPFKSDAFSLGLVILECGVLRSVQGIYQDKDINLDTLLELLEEFISIYDNHIILKESLMWLLDIDEKERKDPKRILQMIKEMKEEAVRMVVQEFTERHDSNDGKAKEQNKMEIVELNIPEEDKSPVLDVSKQRFDLNKNTKKVQAQSNDSNTNAISNQRDLTSGVYQADKFTVEEQNFQVSSPTINDRKIENKPIDEYSAPQIIRREFTGATNNDAFEKNRRTDQIASNLHSKKIPERISSEEYLKQTIDNNASRQTAPGKIVHTYQNYSTGGNQYSRVNAQQASQDQLTEVQIEIAPPVVKNPAQYIDRSNLKFDFEHPPSIAVDQTSPQNIRQQAVGPRSSESIDQHFSQLAQNRSFEQKQSENQSQSQLRSVVSQSSYVIGQPIRYQISQATSEYKPVIQESVNFQQLAYQPVYNQVSRIQVSNIQTQTTPSLVPRQEAQTNTGQQQASKELKTIESQQSSKQEISRNEIGSPKFQTDLGSPKSIPVPAINPSPVNFNARQNTIKTENPVKLQKDEITKQVSPTQTSTFENANIRPISAYQSGNDLTRIESSQQNQTYANTHHFPIQPTPSYPTQTYTSQLTSNISSSNLVYRRINADGKLITTTSGPVNQQPIPTSTAQHSNNNDIVRNYTSQIVQPISNQYSSINNYSNYSSVQTQLPNLNYVADIKSPAQTNADSYARYQSIVDSRPVQQIDKSAPLYKVSYSQDPSNVQTYHSVRTITTNPNDKQIQVPSETRIDSRVFDYEVQQSDDGNKRYIIRRNPSQNPPTRIENGYQSTRVIHNPTVYGQQTYTTQTTTQPISYARNPVLANTEFKTTDAKLQADADSSFKIGRVLRSNQEITEHRHVFPTSQVNSVSQYQSNYVANQVRPSATFVNAVIPEINQRQRM